MAAVRWVLAPHLGNNLPFVTFFPALVLAAWYGGFGPALFATAASALIALFWFIPPVGSLDHGNGPVPPGRHLDRAAG